MLVYRREKQGDIHDMVDEDAISKMFGKEKEILPEPPKEKEAKYSENKKAIDDAETELRLERIEFEKEKLRREKEKLAKPDTSIDYYSKMLEMQQAYNGQLLNMQKQNFEIQIQLAKLELGKDDDTMKWIEFLEPYLPTLLQRFGGGQQQQQTQSNEPIYVYDEKGQMIPNPKIYKRVDVSSGDKPEDASKEQTPLKDGGEIPPSSNYEMDVKKYQQEIRDGKISLEQAWQDWQQLIKDNVLPRYLRGMTYEEFTENYNKIRAGK